MSQLEDQYKNLQELAAELPVTPDPAPPNPPPIRAPAPSSPVRAPPPPNKRKAGKESGKKRVGNPKPSPIYT